MKWYKHISDSLDDPFIFDLVNKFGSDGYLVFFGILEIYAREYKPKPNWNLTVTRAYLKQKLHKRQETVIIKCLKYIASYGRVSDEFPTSSPRVSILNPNSRQTPDKLPTNSNKVNQNSSKWEITFNGEQVTIFIPKFTELLDDWTSRKVRSYSEVTPKKHHLDRDKDVDKDKEEDIKKEKPPKLPYREFVSLTKEEHQKLIDKFGKDKTEKMIDILDNAKGSKGYKYKSDYRAILSWVVDKVDKEYIAAAPILKELEQDTRTPEQQKADMDKLKDFMGGVKLKTMD